MPLERRPLVDPQADELTGAGDGQVSAATAGRNVLVAAMATHLEASDKVKVKNTFIDRMGSAEDLDESPVMIQRKKSRSRTLPVQHTPSSGLTDVADEQAEEHDSDQDDEDDVHGDLMDETPFTTRFADQVGTGSMSFGVDPVISAPVMPLTASSPSQTPCRRQIMLQVPIELPPDFLGDDFAALVTRTGVSMQQGSLVVDLQVLLEGQGKTVSTATPASITATSGAAGSPATSQWFSTPGASSTQPTWPTAVSVAAEGQTKQGESAKRVVVSERAEAPTASANKVRSQPSQAATAPKVLDSADDPKSGMVCCHWKNKGFCKLGGSCKFMHPASKQGVGPTRRKNSSDVQDSHSVWPPAPAILSTLSHGKSHTNSKVGQPLMPMMPGPFPMMMMPPHMGMGHHQLQLASALGMVPHALH